MPIIITLERLQESTDAEVSQKAFTFRQTLTNGNFIVATIIICEVFSNTLPLSAALQGKNVDLAAAIEMTENLVGRLKEMRENAQENFKKTL